MFKPDWNKRYTTIAIYAFLVVSAVIILYSTLNNLNVVKDGLAFWIVPLRPIFYGIGIAYILNPMMNFFEKRVILSMDKERKISFKRRRTYSLLLTYMFSAICIGTFLTIIAPQVGLSVYGIASEFTQYVAAAETLVNNILEAIPADLIPDEFTTQLIDYVGSAVGELLSGLTAYIPTVFNLTIELTSGVIQWFMAVMVSIYILASKEKFGAQIKKVMHAFWQEKTVNYVLYVSKNAHSMFGGFITGKIIDSIIIGVLCFVSLTIMNMPNTLLVSCIVGITNVIPYFGPFIGAIPSFFIIFIESPTYAYLFLVFILILQQIDGNIIGPLILGDTTGLSPFWVIFAITLFGGVFGVMGWFIGVPTFAVIYWLIKEFITLKLNNKGLSPNTEDYMQKLE